MEYKKCEECNTPFSGRVDKKFCSCVCRNTYHNRVNKIPNNMIRNINSKLRKNWQILEELNTRNTSTISKYKLDAEGFDFTYYTGIQITENGQTCYYVYDQGYLPSENDNFVLVKRK